jgi:hypothetical protein
MGEMESYMFKARAKLRQVQADKKYKMPLDDFETRQTGTQRRPASHSACCNLKRRVSWFKSRTRTYTAATAQLPRMFIFANKARLLFIMYLPLKSESQVASGEKATAVLLVSVCSFVSSGKEKKCLYFYLAAALTPFLQVVCLCGLCAMHKCSAWSE